MKKYIKTSLWVIGTIVVLLLSLFGWYGIKASSETKKMYPNETALLVDSTYTIKDSFVNLYLVKSGNRYIAIDGGNSIEAIKEGFSKLNICPDSVFAILLTHTDGDHVAAINLLPNAKIYLSKKEEAMVNGEKSRFLFFNNNIFGKSYDVIEDNQILSILNLKIQGILVPGHTPGSMSYLINDKYLFTGDALSLKNGKVSGFNEFFNMDTRMALGSMSKLTNLPNAEYIFTAHHGYADNYKEAVIGWK